ncbi:MAG: hypothetical protein EXR59_01535 [Dehalococcoidia bacterium]|nr:hypothetical protein [Dehalococcoidia bacterium]
MKPTVYLNGNFVHADKASVSSIDTAYLYGYGIFDSLRIYGGVPFLLDRHLARLATGADFLGIDRPNPKTIANVVHELIKRNGDTEARVRITLSMTGIGIVPTLPEKRIATLFIAMMPLDVHSIEQAQSKGVRAIISHKATRTTGPLSAIKGTAQALGIIAQSEAHDSDADEAILLNDKGMLAEGSFSNLFIAKNGVLITPDLKSGILPGITREAVIASAKRNGIPIEMRQVKLNEAVKADEIFLTNSVREIVPIIALNAKAVDNGKPGVITKRLLTAYKALAKRETNRAD